MLPLQLHNPWILGIEWPDFISSLLLLAAVLMMRSLLGAGRNAKLGTMLDTSATGERMTSQGKPQSCPVPGTVGRWYCSCFSWILQNSSRCLCCYSHLSTTVSWMASMLSLELSLFTLTSTTPERTLSCYSQKNDKSWDQSNTFWACCAC